MHVSYSDQSPLRARAACVSTWLGEQVREVNEQIRDHNRLDISENEKETNAIWIVLAYWVDKIDVYGCMFMDARFTFRRALPHPSREYTLNPLSSMISA